MTVNIAENFIDGNIFSDSLIDYFIENIHVRLMGCGIRTAVSAKISNFLLPAFLAVFYSKGSVEIQHGSQTVIAASGQSWKSMQKTEPGKTGSPACSNSLSS